MIKKIVVCLDGSTRSERSLPWVDLLFRDSYKILLRTICNADEKDSAALYLSELAKFIPWSSTAVVEGSPAHSILNVATGVDADLIVATTHGGADLCGTTLGGTSEQLLYGSHIPLLIVPSGGPPPCPVARLHRILVPLDGSELSEMIVPVARDVAEYHHLGLVFAHILTGPEEIKYQYQDMPGHFQRIAHDMEAEGIHAKVVVRRGKLPETLLDIGKEEDAGMMLMSAHGHGGLPRLMFGSVAAKLVRSSPIPIAVCKYQALKKYMDQYSSRYIHAG
jgi:nucleotide-binding universal stress UspA family protein